MATYIHLTDIEGPCITTGHEGWIKMESWNWTGEREMSGTQQVGLASGITKFDGLEFISPTGSASATLIQKMIEAFHFEEVTIHSIKSVGGKEPEPWYKLILGGVMIASVSQTVDSDTANDVVRLVFRSIDMEIADQELDGSLAGPKAFIHDFSTST